MLGYCSSPPPASIGCRPDLPRELPVAANKGGGAEPMSEHIVALALAAAKRLFVEHANLKSGEFNQRSTNRMLRGGVCGILGFGNVGVATARLMRAFGMKIHAINRRGASHEPTDWIATTDLLDEMLCVADVLVISAALTTATERLIGARELALMKENAILINVARGEIIDKAALYAHLVSHPHFFAGIDAWWVEPVRQGHFAMRYPFSRPSERDRLAAQFGGGGYGVTNTSGAPCRIAGAPSLGIRRGTLSAPTSGCSD